MKPSQRWNTLQICPSRGSNSGGSDMWSNALPVRLWRCTVGHRKMAPKCIKLVAWKCRNSYFKHILLNPLLVQMACNIPQICSISQSCPNQFEENKLKFNFLNHLWRTYPYQIVFNIIRSWPLLSICYTFTDEQYRIWSININKHTHMIWWKTWDIPLIPH